MSKLKHLFTPLLIVALSSCGDKRGTYVPMHDDGAYGIIILNTTNGEITRHLGYSQDGFVERMTVPLKGAARQETDTLLIIE
jgi:hypothetical protein